VGYLSEGSDVITCGVDGNWTDLELTCRGNEHFRVAFLFHINVIIGIVLSMCKFGLIARCAIMHCRRCGRMPWHFNLLLQCMLKCKYFQRNYDICTE
jgi:hypothetical protein